MFAKNELTPRFRGNWLENSRTISLQSTPFQNHKHLVFPCCIGLAAGFDKDGVAIAGLMDMGFGFVEIGSITPLPQPGNPKPRLFRLKEDLGVINRFGFNSIGAEAVEANLKRFRSEQVQDVQPVKVGGNYEKKNSYISVLSDTTKQLIQTLFRQTNPSQYPLLGINLGKNKHSAEEVRDYVNGIRHLGPYADYLVVNISSPNTPGLRDLQKKDPLKRLLKAAVSARNSIVLNSDKGTLPPLLVKIAPDISEEGMKEIASVVIECGIDGILVSNTTNQRPESLVSKFKNEKGGLSGAPLNKISTTCIRQMYKLTDGNVPIIGLGGIGSGQDVYEKLKAGASLVQIYSMLVYEGPGMVSTVRKELVQLMEQNGQKNLDDVVGLDHDEIYWKKRLKRETSGSECQIREH